MIEPSFHLARYGQWVVLTVVGEIDMATAPKLRQQVQQAIRRQPDGLVIDLDAVDFIDSTGLGVLVGAAKRMRMADGQLRIVNSQRHLSELFEITRLDEVFDLHETFEDAVEDVPIGEAS